MSQERFPFEYESVADDGKVTAYGGLPLVAETLRALGVSDAVAEHVQLGGRRRRHDSAWMVESFAMLLAAGGDCLDDMGLLEDDKALGRLVGRDFPSPETARRFLYSFHDDELIESARKAASKRGQSSFIPAESPQLAGLAKANTALVRAVAARGSCTRATIDVDATIQESTKREATEHYKGGRGYQPVAAYWVEQDLVVADEFRDGHVPAGKETLPIIQRAFEALPPEITTRRLRADSAMYVGKTLKWLVRNDIEFTISADMSAPLRERCEALKEDQWHHLEDRQHEQVAVSEVEFEPSGWAKKDGPLRYLVVRYTPVQGRLFEMGRGPKYLAVVTNREGDAARLLKWHWQKAGTIERLHDVTKNELGAANLPCGRFGANAAWYRLVMLTYNVLSALKSIALPPALHDARPKRIRYHLLVQVAELVAHARSLLARVRERAHSLAMAALARRLLWRPIMV